MAVLPSNPTAQASIAAEVYTAVREGYADSTNRSDVGALQVWMQICKELETDWFRNDHAANSGADGEGFREEILLQAQAVLMKYARMKPRRKTDLVADPNSAGNWLHQVHREHLKRGVIMAPTRLAMQAVRGLCRRHAKQIGIRDQHRKLPLTNRIIADMHNTPDGSSHKGLVCNWNTYEWIAHKAWTSVCAEGGERKDEIAKVNQSADSTPDRFKFDSLVFKIGGKKIRRPTLAQLDLLGTYVGDGVYLTHGSAKNDFFGKHFAATPSFHPCVQGQHRCAAFALANLVRAANLRPDQWETTPLFGPQVGEEFTHYQVERAFELMLIHGAHIPPEELSNYSIHSFRIFVACYLYANKVSRHDIKRLVRWLGDNSLELYARLNDDEWTSYTTMGYSTVVESNIAARLRSEGPLDWHDVVQQHAGFENETNADSPRADPILANDTQCEELLHSITAGAPTCTTSPACNSQFTTNNNTPGHSEPPGSSGALPECNTPSSTCRHANADIELPELEARRPCSGDFIEAAPPGRAEAATPCLFLASPPRVLRGRTRAPSA